MADEEGVLDQIDEETLEAAPGTWTGISPEDLGACAFRKFPSSDRVHPVFSVISAGH